MTVGAEILCEIDRNLERVLMVGLLATLSGSVTVEPGNMRGTFDRDEGAHA